MYIHVIEMSEKINHNKTTPTEQLCKWHLKQKQGPTKINVLQGKETHNYLWTK